jgi:hypothetical protein
LVPVAKKRRIKSILIMAMNRPGILLLQHPEWYMVSKGGKSFLTHVPMWIIINGFALLEKNLEIMYQV